MNSAVFLDRDGVINRKAIEGEYITSWEQMELLPGVAEGIALLNRAGFCVIVVTNQRCVAKGLISEGDLQDMHRRLREVLAHDGARIDAIYYCPHDLGSRCVCRKPAPGMLLEAAKSRKVELGLSWMIGDSESDIEAGNSAGCKTILLLETGERKVASSKSEASPDSADLVASSLNDAIRQILRYPVADGSFRATEPQIK
jgi:D-glycero-D-manno-heptose 1,7-bisphosphate phosphatase